VPALPCCSPALLRHPVARAVDLDDLLPVDEAYVVKAEATAPGTVAVHFTIAKGYYLYRHRFGLQPVDPAVRARHVQIPAGDKHHDQFLRRRGDLSRHGDAGPPRHRRQ
jgi:thiol:disulfide interchange protein DsbD